MTAHARIDRRRLEDALRTEESRFVETHPVSRRLAAEARTHLLDGVPMPWMMRWPGPFPLFVASASGAHCTDVDGFDYLDLCLGDTGAMGGHAAQPTIDAVTRQMQRGVTTMLPSTDAAWVAAELAHRFGLPYWQFALTATDANRFAIRLARHITGRPRILVFNWCYHGTVDETFITLDNGLPRPRPGTIGPPVDPTLTTRVVEFNDLPALEEALSHHDVACVLAEPVMTNIGIIHPTPGFHDALRALTRKTGTLLLLDETHTLCAGPGGYSARQGLAPDMLVVGKPLAGGLPAAVYGMTAAVAARISHTMRRDLADTGGIGGTLAGNALSLAAMRATLESVLTPQAFGRAIHLAKRWLDGVQQTIDSHGLPWHVTQLGCRAEYWFCPQPMRNGGEAAAAVDPLLDRYMHLAALNRGFLLTPFHNMALLAPQASEEEIDRHTCAFAESVEAILA